MVTILVLVCVFFFGKFIYDTYLTDNTEREFDKYRESNPIDAAKIEPPKTEQQFNELITALGDEYSSKQQNRGLVDLSSGKKENISKLFPEFVSGLTRMKIKTDSTHKLELENIGHDENIFMTIEQNLSNRKFYFYAEIKDQNSNSFRSETIELGNYEIVASRPINWDQIFQNAFTTIGVKQIRKDFENTITDSQKKLTLRYDGYYWTQYFVGTSEILRFYPDGAVIYFKRTGDLEPILPSFNRDNEYVQKGKYSMVNNVIDFTVSNPRSKTNSFVGFLQDSSSIHLNIDGARQVNYLFVEY